MIISLQPVKNVLADPGLEHIDVVLDIHEDGVDTAHCQNCEPNYAQ